MSPPEPPSEPPLLAELDDADVLTLAVVPDLLEETDELDLPELFDFFELDDVLEPPSPVCTLEVVEPPQSTMTAARGSAIAQERIQDLRDMSFLRQIWMADT